MSTAYHMVNYRVFSLVEPDGADPTLEALCRSALDGLDRSGVSLWERLDDRICEIDVATGSQLVLNRVADLTSAVYGELCLVQEKGLQAFLEQTQSKVQLSDLTLAQVFSLAEKAAPQGFQFIRGLAYWLTLGNHLFFITVQNMTSGHLSDYFDWLFHTRSSTLASNQKVRLQAEFDRSEIVGDIGDIKSLHVSGKSRDALIVQPAQEDDTPGKTTRTKERLVAAGVLLTEQAKPIADALLGHDKAEELVQSLGPGEYLTASANLSVRGKRSEASRKKMREVASELADLTDREVRIAGKDGVISQGDAILRTRMPFNVPHEGSILLDFENVADQLQEVYARFVADQKITA